MQGYAAGKNTPDISAAWNNLMIFCLLVHVPLKLVCALLYIILTPGPTLVESLPTGTLLSCCVR